MTTVKEDYLQVIKNNITHTPRSTQTRIGPSELGTTCMKTLANKLAKTPQPPQPPSWIPNVGTALHTQMEDFFGHKNQNGRWLIEQKVKVGTIGNETITGSCDLYDTHTNTVIDHKFLGKPSLRKYRANGVPAHYEAQAHLYGLGFLIKGYPVKNVLIACVPRDGQLNDTYFWGQPFNPNIAGKTMARANQVLNQIHTQGLATVLATYPDCGQPYCVWCNQTKTLKQAIKQTKTY